MQKHREFWFVVGSQFLYGPEVLEIVEGRAREMAAELSKALPYPLVYKVTAKTNQEIAGVVKEANYSDACAGIVTWCHTFSPSKMWINGFANLQPPTGTGSTASSPPGCGCPGRSSPATGRTRRSAGGWATGCAPPWARPSPGR